MRSFKDILFENKREFKYRIKTVVDITDKLDLIMSILKKYEVLDMSTVTKTIVQDHPIDFNDIENSEVWILDVVTEYPVSHYALLQDLRGSLNIPENFIVVRSENDPLEIQARERAIRIDADREVNLPRAALLDDSEYSEHSGPIGSELYGDKYNEEFKKHLATVAATRKEETAHIENKSLFSWLSDDLDPDAFNSEIEGAPRVYTGKTDKTKIPASDMRSNHGNFDDSQKQFSQKYRKGDEEIIIKTDDWVGKGTK